MKNSKSMKKVLCALGMSTLLAAGVVGAASTTNGAAMQAANKPAMQSTWNGMGAVQPGQKSTEIDYVGALTTFQRQFPGAMVSSLSYDAKHHPTYEVEGFTKTHSLGLKVDEATGQIVSQKVKPAKNANKKGINLKQTIIPETAETKALEKVGGDFQTMEWELEKQGSKVVYEFDMTNGGDKKATVKVDAMTGQVLSSKVKTTKY